MRTLFCLSLVFLSVATFHVAVAQTIDAGRGELPVVVPEGYTKANAAPLVVLLHGYTSSGQGQESYMKFGALADEYGFLLVAPDGTKEDSERSSRFWNASDACCNLFGSDVDDSTYVQNVIDKVKADYTIDPNRVFLIGHSNGGFMTYRMAYDHSDTIAAIASLAGATQASDDRPAPPHSVNVLQIHGTEDATILYGGGEIQGHAYPSAVGSVEQWAAYNGCEVKVTTSQYKLDLEKKIEGDETTVTQYTNACKSGGVVELWSIQGGSHIPQISDTFSKSVIEWLLAHPKVTS